jgi:hypothetical protein
MPLLHKTWTEFFQAKALEKGPYKTLAEGSFDPLNAATRRHINNISLLQLSIISSRYDFFLFSVGSKNVQMVHIVILVSLSLGDGPVL